jgi:hypothetical protein
MKFDMLRLISLLCVWALTGCQSANVTSPPATTLPSPRSSPTLTPPLATPTPIDAVGPNFDSIAASSKVFARSDCTPMSITITAYVSDPSGVKNVALWYRVGSGQPYASVKLDGVGVGKYAATVTGAEAWKSEYGVWEFYLTAEDGVGNLSQSPLDTSVSLLPCVG